MPARGEASALRWTEEVLAATPPGEDGVRVRARGDELLLLVVDGAGGVSGGAEATAALLGWLDEAPQAEGDIPWELLAAEWLEALDARLQAAPDMGEAACVLARLAEGEVRGASAGDCRARVAAGPGDRWLTLRQRRERLGSGNAAPVPFRDQMGPDDVLVLGTDGLWKYADPDLVTTRARQGARAGELAALPRLASGALPDDVAVVVVRGG